MNPIKITLRVFVAWIALTIVCVFFVKDTSEKPFTVMVYSFYLMPFICLITLIISAFFYRTWVKSHKKAVTIALTLLAIWSLFIALYIRSLF